MGQGEAGGEEIGKKLDQLVQTRYDQWRVQGGGSWVRCYIPLIIVFFFLVDLQKTTSLNNYYYTDIRLLTELYVHGQKMACLKIVCYQLLITIHCNLKQQTI